MKKRWMALGALFLVACGTAEEVPVVDTEQSSYFAGGKSDGFNGDVNTLVITGDRNETIVLDDDASQCESTQFDFLGAWRNPSDEGFSMPLFRAHVRFRGGFVPLVGETYDLSGPDGELRFDGIGYASGDGTSCHVTVQDFVNDGKEGDFGIAVSFDSCEMVKDDRKIVVTGAVGCSGDGFNLLFDPGPRPVDPEPDSDPTNPDVTDPVQPTEVPQACTDDEYRGWMSGFLSELTSAGSAVSSSEAADLDARLAERPCDAVHEVLYLEWLQDYAARMRAFGALSDGEKAVLDYALSAKPEPATQASYSAWLGLYGEVMQAVAPNNQSIIDDGEAVRLAYAHHARVMAEGDTAYQAWFELTERYYRLIATNQDAIFKDNELILLDELMSHKPVAGGTDSMVAFLGLYDFYLDLIVVGRSSIVDDGEAEIIERTAQLRPANGSDGSYAAWVSSFVEITDRVGSSARDSALVGLQAYLDIKPCVDTLDSETVLAAFADIPQLEGSDPRQAFVSRAGPQACATAPATDTTGG